MSDILDQAKVSLRLADNEEEAVIAAVYAQQAIAAALIALVERLDKMTTEDGELIVAQDWFADLPK